MHAKKTAFVVEHERQHGLYTREDYNKEFPDGNKGGYETQINERALLKLYVSGVVPNRQETLGLDDIFAP